MKQQPLKKFRAGSVSAAIWERESTINGKAMSFMSVSRDRRYKDVKGEWQSSNSYGRNEIPLAIHVLAKAFEAIVQE